MLSKIGAWFASLFLVSTPIVAYAPPFQLEISEIPQEVSLQLADLGGVSDLVGRMMEDEEFVEATTSIYCSCVRTARMLGAKIPLIDAKDMEANSPPTAGGGVLFSYENYDHVAYIVALLDKGMIVREGNFRRCQYSERVVRYDNKFIRGFIYEPE